MTFVVRLEKQRLDPPEELHMLLDLAGGDGAAVSFVGIARAEDGRVERLFLEHHPALTERSLRDIALAAAERFAVSHVRIVHRCGEIKAGEPIVFAGVASTHRRAAFEAADYLMDLLKTEAVLWKREEGPAGPKWIEPTDTDLRARARWS